MDSNKKQHNPNPKATANPISKLFLWWTRKLLWKGYRRELEEHDLYTPLPKDQSELLGDRLEKAWNKELLKSKRKGSRPSFLRAIFRAFWLQYAFYGIILAFQCLVVRIAQPLLLGKVIEYFSVEESMTLHEVYAYAGGMVATVYFLVCFQHHYTMGTACIGMRIRIACCSLLYRKVLRLNRASMDLTATGQIVNLMSNDVSRFDLAPQYLHWMWISCIQVPIVTYCLWKYVGISAIIGFVFIFCITIPVQGYLGKITSRLRKRIATRTDERMKQMNEIVSGIQVIKMYAWEKPFAKLVSMARRSEIDVVTKTSYIRGYYLSSLVFVERSSLFVTLMSYALFGNEVAPHKVFAMAQFYNVLNQTMASFYSLAVANSAETYVTVKRLQNFLLLGENEPLPAIEANITDSQPRKTVPTGIQLNNATAKWSGISSHDTLKNICLDLKPGQLCAIIGPVGSGKSSILHTVLKELPLSSGTISVGGSVSYACQEPWIFVGSVRQNILFGQPYHPDKYREVVRVCALKRDFEMFPYGDRTLVGDKGISLSGGQRARINLARAVYRNADIYLLDDPLSAVDTHVGKHLFDECISAYLANKTRILVTHQLQYLQDADVIVLLINGSVQYKGTFAEMQRSGLNFAKLLAEPEKEEQPEQPQKRQRLTSEMSTNSYTCEEDDLKNLRGPQENKEMRSTGSISWSAYGQYLKAGGSAWFLLFVATMLVIAQVATSGADYWVTYWTREEVKRNILYKATLANQTSPDFYNNISIDHLPTTFSRTASICIYAGVVVGCIILIIIRSMLFYKLCMNASIRLHDRMFDSILRGAMRFFDLNPSGRILNRFSKDMGAIDELLPRALLEAIQIFLVMSGILTMVLYVNYWLLLPMLVIGTIFYLISCIFLSTARNVKRLEGITRSPVFSHLSDSLNGLTTIRASGTQDIVRKEFDGHQDLHTAAWSQFIATSTAFGIWLDCLSAIFVTLVTFSFLVLGGDTPGANVGLAISQSLILTVMVQHGILQITEVVSQMTSVERVLEYTNIEKEPALESEEGKQPPESWPSTGTIEFRNMSLHYSDVDPPVLKDLNFVIQTNHKVGIVGRTGAGKSSLISALFRLAKIEGNIFIDGVETGRIGLHDLRKRISIIPQEPVLFSASLRSNLDPFGEFDDNLLWSALEEVELKSAVESLDFQVTEGGSNFSVGQRQLVCLARAILRNNKILVLDEATANVDPETDALIQETIRKKFRDCTVLTIAHRLHTIMDSDRVLVMDAGTMVEYDHPHDLLQNPDGYFYKLVHETGKNMADHLHVTALQALRKTAMGGDEVKENEMTKL